MPSFTRSLRGVSISTESETLIDQAVQAVETQTSTDPVVINENAQFEAEIARLKAKTEEQAPAADADAGGSEGGDAPGEAEPTEPVEAAPAEGDNADTPAADAPEADASDEPVQVDEDSFDKAAAEVVEDDTPGGDLESAADKPAVSEEQAVAVESFHAVLDKYHHLMQVHETGRIQSVHVGLCSATFNRVGRTHRLETPALSLESGDGVLARIAQFIRELIAKVKAAFASLFNWVRDFLRGYKASTGKYEASRQGVQDRVNHLKGAGITVTDAMLKGKTVKVPALFNTYGNEVKDVGSSIADLSRFTDFVKSSLSTPEVAATFAFNIEVVDKFAQAGSASFASNIPAKPISAEALFGKQGNLSKMGDSSFIRDNVDYESTTSANNKRPGLRVKNLVGGYNYEWTLEEDENFVSLQDRSTRFRQVEFRQSRNTAEFEVQALTPQGIEVIMAMADQLVAQSDSLLDVLSVYTKNAEGLKNRAAKVLDNITRNAQEKTITEQESFVLASVTAIAADVYTRVTITSTAKLIAHLRATADALINWAVLSSTVVDDAIKKA